MLGLLLVLGMVIAASVVIVVAGAMSFEQSQSTVAMKSAETAMEELNSEIERVAGSPGGRATVSMPSMQDATLRVEETGWINVSVEHRINGSAIGGRSSGWIQLGKIVYEQAQRSVAIQAGGVWRTNRGGASVSMVEPPDFGYRTRGDGPTLSLPIVPISGAEIDGGTVTVTASASAGNHLAHANPIRYDQQLNVTVRSEFYRGWARLFESRTAGHVRVDASAKRVTLILDGPDLEYLLGDVPGAVLSPTGAGYPENGNLIDSYNSLNGSYGATQGTEAFVGLDGPFVPGNSVTIKGDLHSTAGSGDGEISNSPESWGETRFGDDVAIANSPRFGRDSDPGSDVFSTTGNLTYVSTGAVFDGDVLVGGHVYNRNIGTEGFRGHVKEDLSVAEGARRARGARIDGDVTVGGALRFQRDVDVGGSIHVGGAVTFGHQAHYTGPAVNASGDVTLAASGATVEADVSTRGNVTLEKKGTIVGTVRAGGQISLDSQATIDGDVYVVGGTSSIDEPGKVTGTIHNVSVVSVPVRDPTPPREPFVPPLSHAPATRIIEAKWFDLRTPISNASAYFTGDTCTGGDCDLELTAGEYTTESVRITGDERATLNTTDGDIEIYVEREVRIEQDNHVEVVGNGTVSVYVNGTSGHEDVYIRGANVGAADHDATALRILTRPSAHVGIGGDANVVGIIYGPGSARDNGTAVRIDNQAEVYGSVVGDFDGPDASVSNDVEIHYDTALGILRRIEAASVDRESTPGTVKYVRVSVGGVSVDG
ncbi:MAG: hypothetical protein ABEJ27_05375 [Halodesulfurarchaeum sp.]